MSSEGPNSISLTRQFNATPGRVFEAWLDPETASQWLFTSASSEENTTEIDAREGGAWVIVDKREGTAYRAVGQYLEIERPRRLVFTFSMPQFSPDIDRVTVEILPTEAGCALTLIQEGLPSGYESETKRGWEEMFDALEMALAGRGSPPISQ